MARFDFNTSEYEDVNLDYEVIPEGDYEMMLEESELKETSTGGMLISAQFQILGPSHAGRKVWTNFNIENRSEKAQKIGRAQVAMLMRACGKPNSNDTDDIVNIPFIGSVDIEAGTGGYKDKNIVTGFHPKDGAPVANTAPKAAAPAPSRPAPAPAKPAATPAKAGATQKAPWD